MIDGRLGAFLPQMPRQCLSLIISWQPKYYYTRYDVLFSFSAHMSALKLTQIGNSVGVILPKEVLARLKLAKGDAAYLSDNPNGVTLTTYQPNFEEQVNADREFMCEYLDTFRALAMWPLCQRAGTGWTSKPC